MKQVMLALLKLHDRDPYRGRTGNEIGYACGFRSGSDRLAHDGRSMAVANRVNFAVTALEKRDLVGFARREDRKSGTAYRLTRAGITVAQALREESKMSDAPAVKPGYEAENMEVVPMSQATFLPGEFVTIRDDDEVYPGERGEVLAVGTHEAFGGSLAYDILIDGCSDPERFLESEIAEAQ